MPAIADVTSKLKSIPPIAWVIGAGIVIAFLILSKSGGGGASPAGVTGAGGGDNSTSFTPDAGQTITDIFEMLRQNAEADEAFREQVQPLLDAAAPAVPGSGTPSTPTKAPLRFDLLLPKSGAYIYDAKGKVVDANAKLKGSNPLTGKNSNGTPITLHFDTKLYKIGGKEFYRINAGKFKGMFVQKVVVDRGKKAVTA